MNGLPKAKMDRLVSHITHSPEHVGVVTVRGQLTTEATARIAQSFSGCEKGNSMSMYGWTAIELVRRG